MGLFDFLRTPNQDNEDQAINFSVPGKSSYTTDVLRVDENRSYGIYNFGITNDYPQKLIDLYDQSPTNQAVINRTALMIAGDGTEVDIVDPKDVFNIVHTIALQKHANEKQTLDQVIYKLAFDLKLHGRYAIECIWNKDHSKVVQLKAIDVAGVRIGIMEDNTVTKYYYSEDWLDRKKDVIEYAPFDKYSKSNRQLLYVQLTRAGQLYYGLPDYYASLRWIELEKEIGKHYLDSATQGFSPKLSVVFPGKPESEAVEDKIIKGLNDKYTGSMGRKIIGIFAPRPELKPEFNP
ncbi:MAG: hypothetical protein ACYTBJ_17625, partial [Planctomycetota bacterium]